MTFANVGAGTSRKLTEWQWEPLNYGLRKCRQPPSLKSLKTGNSSRVGTRKDNLSEALQSTLHRGEFQRVDAESEPLRGSMADGRRGVAALADNLKVDLKWLTWLPKEGNDILSHT